VEVLHIAAQDGVPTLWAIVDPQRPRDGYTEVVAWGTGWPLPDDVYQECDYWGSCEDGYGYIWHYFAAARYPERTNWTTNDLWLHDADYKYYNAFTADKLYTFENAPSSLTFTAPTITLSSHASDENAVSIDMEVLKKLAGEIVEDCHTATNKAYQ
jgi:hypothetical protein